MFDFLATRHVGVLPGIESITSALEDSLDHWKTDCTITKKKISCLLPNCGFLSSAGASFYLHQCSQNNVWCLGVAQYLDHGRSPVTVPSRQGGGDNSMASLGPALQVS